RAPERGTHRLSPFFHDARPRQESPSPAPARRPRRERRRGSSPGRRCSASRRISGRPVRFRCSPRSWRHPGGIDFGECLAREAHRIDSGGQAAVDSHLQEDLADLFTGDAIGERGLDVQLELVRPVEGADHREIDQAPIAPLEARAAPDAAPAILGRELLHRPAEVVRSGERLLDVLLAEHGLADFQPALKEIVHDLFPWLGEISQPARSSITRATQVQSESAPYLSCAACSSSVTSRPTAVGTPSAAASSRHSRRSLSASPVENPKSKRRVSTCFGYLSVDAVLRPLDTFSTSSISCGSSPALTPSASASAVIAIAAWDIRLLASFSVCPRPGFSPTKNTLPRCS